MDKKHMFVIAACVVAILLLLGVSTYAYSQVKYERQLKNDQATQIAEIDAKAVAKAKKDFAYQLYLLTENCKKDIATARAAKKSLPVCSPTLKPLQ